MNQIYILDTSALLSVQQVLTFFSDTANSSNTFLTTSAIISELKDQISKLRVESMISSQALFVKEVDIKSLHYIDDYCKRIGNFDRLSSQDRSVLSLAWQEKQQNPNFDVIVLSDDYEIQNTAKIIKLHFKSVKTKGISYSAKFKKYCTACGELLSEEDTFCPECGSTSIKKKKYGLGKKKHPRKY